MSKASWVFNLKNDTRGILRTLAPGVDANIFPGDKVMLSVVKIEPHAKGSVHAHPEEQWGVLLEGRCTRIQNDEAIECTAGDFWYTPGGVMHGIVGGDGPSLVLDIFSPPREEYKQAGKGFGAAKIG